MTVKAWIDTHQLIPAALQADGSLSVEVPEFLVFETISVPLAAGGK